MKKINLSLNQPVKQTPSTAAKTAVFRWSEKRKHPRADLWVKVTLYPVSEDHGGLEVSDQGFEGKSCDISESGIRIELNDVDVLANTLKIILKINQKSSVELFAKLAWQKGDNCGFQCIVLTDEALAQIRDYVKKLKKIETVSYRRKKCGGRPLGSKNGGSVSWDKL